MAKVIPIALNGPVVHVPVPPGPKPVGQPRGKLPQAIPYPHPENVVADPPPPRRPHTRTRTREHLTPPEIDRLLKAARKTRWPARDHALVLVSYGHGLRVSEALQACWEDFDLDHGVYHVHRLKGSISGDHPLRGVEIRALRLLKRRGPTGDFVFASERGGRLTTRGVRKLVDRLAKSAGLGKLNIHPHMFRHSCGYKLINQGTDLRTVQAYLGHANIRHTVKYTHLSPKTFRRLWDD